MSAGFDREQSGQITGISERRARRWTAAGVSLGRTVLWLLAALVVGCGVWMLIPPSKGDVGQDLPKALALAAAEPAVAPAGSAPPAESALSQAQTLEAAALDRLKISSQTWRRGGLGSKALVTFTLRNDNDYAVKDVEVVCTFARRDGSHLTDRSRVLAEIVDMKSRKTFARVPVGFVNVNADRAKCSLVAARRA